MADTHMRFIITRINGSGGLVVVGIVADKNPVPPCVVTEF